jgi:hypothetical protein
MNLQVVLDELDAVLELITSTLPGNVYQPGRRTQIAVAYAHIVLQHQRAIASALNERLHSAAMSLARPTYEALVKGLWLYHCATDDRVESHARGRELEDVAKLLADLDSAALPEVVQFSLRQVKAKYWKTLSSLTHVGHRQVRWWLNPRGVTQDYPTKALEELANFANFMALVAGLQLAECGGNTSALTALESALPLTPPGDG